jgi:hypothetical protein
MTLTPSEYYCQQVIDLVERKENQEGWKKIYDKGLFHVRQFNCVIEQFVAYCAVNARGVHATPLFYEDEMVASPDGKARELGYTHMMATKKGAKFLPFCEAIALRAKRMRPDACETVKKFLKS